MERISVPARRALLRQTAKRLGEVSPLSEDDRRAVEMLAGETRLSRRGEDLTDLVDHGPHIIVAGWACQMRDLGERKRQIFKFLVPGDVIGSFWRRPDVTPYRTVALTPLEALPAGALLLEISEGVPAAGAALRAFRRAEDQAQALFFDHMVRLGSRDAHSGVAYLLLELHDRLVDAGLADEGLVPLPIGQRALAQAMGYSLTHVNQTLRRLTDAGLIEWTDASMRLLERKTVVDLAGLIPSDVDEELSSGDLAAGARGD